MAILDWPPLLAVASSELHLAVNQITYRNPRSRVQLTQKRGRETWVCRLALAPLGDEARASAEQLLAALDGAVNAVWIHDFARPVPRGSAAPVTWDDGTLFDDGSGWEGYDLTVALGTGFVAARGQSSVRVACPAGTAGETVLRFGDKISFAAPDGTARSTLHKVTADAVVEPSETAMVQIAPALQAALSDGDTIRTQAPRVAMLLADPVEGAMPDSVDGTSALELNLVERV